MEHSGTLWSECVLLIYSLAMDIEEDEVYICTAEVIFHEELSPLVCGTFWNFLVRMYFDFFFPMGKIEAAMFLNCKSYLPFIKSCSPCLRNILELIVVRMHFAYLFTRYI